MIKANNETGEITLNGTGEELLSELSTIVHALKYEAKAPDALLEEAFKIGKLTMNEIEKKAEEKEKELKEKKEELKSMINKLASLMDAKIEIEDEDED